MELEKLRNKLDRFEFFKKACKFMDEGRWDEAKAYLEVLVAFVNICENEEKR